MIETDHRERESETARALLRSGADLRFVFLRTGDYRIDGALSIERKSSWDFLQSLFDGRLSRQAIRLSRSSPRPLFLVEGVLPRLEKPTVRGALVTLACVIGVPVLFSRDPADSAQWILQASRQYAARREDAVSRPGRRPRGKRARQLFVLQGLPGVGPRRAAALLDRFGSVRGAMSAEAPLLLQVEGVGARTARKIAWITS